MRVKYGAPRTPIQPPRFPKLRDAVALDHTGTSASGLATSVIGSVAWVSVADCWARLGARSPNARPRGSCVRLCGHKDTPGLKPRPEWRTIRSKAERSSSAPSVRLQKPGDVARDAIATVPSTGEEPPPTPVSSADADGTPLPAPPPKPRHADGEHDYMAVAQAREITTFAFDASKPAHVKVGADAGGLRCEP